MEINCPAQCFVKEKCALSDCLERKPQTAFIPTLKDHFFEISRVLQNGLSPFFERVDVSVRECPDLTRKPLGLPKSGICGDSTITRIGSFDYLLPFVNQEKQYDLMDIANVAGIRAGMILGGGTGPLNCGPCETTAALAFCEEDKGCSRSLHGRVDKSSKGACCSKAKNELISMQGQMFTTEAKEGKVIQILASRRRSCSSIGEMISQILKNKYGRGDTPMAMGIVMVLENAGASFNVLAEHPCEPYHTFPNIENYYSHFKMQAPVVGVGSIISHDPNNLDFKMHQIHVYNESRTMTGQFENDTDPNIASYQIYLVPATKMCRMDKPVY